MPFKIIFTSKYFATNIYVTLFVKPAWNYFQVPYMNRNNSYTTWTFSVEIKLHNHSDFHANYPRHHSDLKKPNLQFSTAKSHGSSCHRDRPME